MKKKIFAVAMAACITALTGCTSGGGSQNGGKTIPTGMPDYSAYETQKVMWIGGWNPPPPKHITSEYDETYIRMPKSRLNSKAIPRTVLRLKTF